MVSPISEGPENISDRASKEIKDDVSDFASLFAKSGTQDALVNLYAELKEVNFDESVISKLENILPKDVINRIRKDAKLYVSAQSQFSTISEDAVGEKPKKVKKSVRFVDKDPEELVFELDENEKVGRKPAIRSSKSKRPKTIEEKVLLREKRKIRHDSLDILRDIEGIKENILNYGGNDKYKSDLENASIRRDELHKKLSSIKKLEQEIKHRHPIELTEEDIAIKLSGSEKKQKNVQLRAWFRELTSKYTDQYVSEIPKSDIESHVIRLKTAVVLAEKVVSRSSRKSRIKEVKDDISELNSLIAQLEDNLKQE